MPPRRRSCSRRRSSWSPRNNLRASHAHDETRNNCAIYGKFRHSGRFRIFLRFIGATCYLLTMPTLPQSVLETRRAQMFPTLDATDIERVRRFGEVRAYAAGDALAKVGTVGNLMVILSGKVDITQHGELGRSELIVTHGPGSFMGELAQLAGRPALVDAHAQEPVEALIIEPSCPRALLIAEAELGERIMRALILRRVGLIETGGGGPVIVGRPE